jgi:antitoxin (DNA-binding transcriptional repressor) of toxin-antitoxin stability system
VSHVTIEEVALRLSDLITATPAGEEIILTRNSLPIAKLIPLPERRRPRRGSGRGFIRRIAEDFDETPEGFEEYMTGLQRSEKTSNIGSLHQERVDRSDALKFCGML